MAYGLYISAEGAVAQSLRLETIANNLANVDTAGFKRDLALFQARFAEATDRGLDFPGSGSINDLGGGVMAAGTQTDYSSGPLRVTNIPTDMAIDGPGFFLVRKGDESLLTRAGNFSLEPDGTLTTQDGYPVLSEDGSPVMIDTNLGPWDVTADGSVVQEGSRVPLALVAPASLSDLVKVGENQFRPLAAPLPVAPTDRHVVSGYLEGSGVKATTEMMEMIETSRAFEANVNMIRHQDQMLGTLIGRVLRVA